MKRHFGLDDESAGDPDTLLHATRSSLGRRFKTVKADGVNDAQGAFAAFDGKACAGSSGASTFSERWAREIARNFEDDGKLGDRHRPHGVPVDGAGAAEIDRSTCEAMWIATTGRAQERQIWRIEARSWSD